MINCIGQRQLLSNNLERLAAQRVLYSTAKTVMSIQLILCVPVIIFLSILTQYLKSPSFINQFGHPAIDISRFVAMSGVLITLLDVICLSPIIAKFKERAAKIQELFDCDVLYLHWNAISAGSKTSPEDIIDNANKLRKKDLHFKALQNWYSKEVENIPLPVARILCQRSNFRWDVDLRKKLNICLYILTALTFIFLLMIGIIGGLNIEKFIMVVFAPCLPIFEFSIRYVYQNKKAIISLKNTKLHAENAWENAIQSLLSDNQLEDIARKLQDILFFNRKTNPLIFDKLYWIFQSHQENAMNYSCEQMINEYKERKNN